MLRLVVGNSISPVPSCEIIDACLYIIHSICALSMMPYILEISNDSINICNYSHFRVESFGIFVSFAIACRGLSLGQFLSPHKEVAGTIMTMRVVNNC
jgi:hypothetical protein